MSRETADRVMDAYYAEVRECDLLPVDEERTLFRAYRTCAACTTPYTEGATQARCPKCQAKRNLRARERLVEGALRFVVKVAKDYARRARGANYDPELLQSLISAGNLGLLVAVDRFELERETRFLTYAAWWVREKILEELDNMGIVRVPAYRQKALRARRKQGDTTVPDLPHVVLEEVAAIDGHHNDDQVESSLLNTYGVARVHKALRDLQLRGRDQYILLAYFGVREEPKNLRQISIRLDLSSERVRQIKKDVLDQLRTFLGHNRIETTEDVFDE